MKSSLLIATAMIVGVVAAFAVDIDSDYDRAADLSQLRSFSFKEQTKRALNDPLKNNDLAERRLRNALETNLEAVGILKNDASPDFVIAYTAALQPKYDVTTSGRFRLGGGRAWVNESTQAMAIVDFLDAKTGAIVWRGYMSGTLSNPDKSEEKLRDAVKKLIARFAKDQKQQKQRKG